MAMPEDYPKEHYLRLAEEAERRAEFSVSEDAKLMMLEAAAQWRSLAKHRQERST